MTTPHKIEVTCTCGKPREEECCRRCKCNNEGKDNLCHDEDCSCHTPTHEEKQVEDCGCVNFAGNGLIAKYCSEHLKDNVHEEKESWEKEFDKTWNVKKLDELNKGKVMAVPDFEAIKAFFRKTLHPQATQIQGELDGMRKGPKHAEGKQDLVLRFYGYNEALSHAKEVVGEYLLK